VTHAQPRNAVVVLLDSLNRHMLGSYGGSEFATPHLDRFAANAPHASPATSPARCRACRRATTSCAAALDFLWRPWGSIELWEQPITADLRHDGVTTMLVTDHPHLFETGGENYHTDFGGWDYVRGHEGDPWKTWLDPSWVGVPAPPAAKGDWFLRRRYGDHAPKIDRAYDRTRTHFRTEDDYPGPRTMAAAADWVGGAAQHHADTRWLLFVDEFDPHEPFDTPEPWQGMYEDAPWDGERLIWPPYVIGGVSGGHLSEAEARHLRGQLRREADDDRPLVRPHPRAVRSPRPVGRHRAHRVHRPRALPRRGTHYRARPAGRHLGQADGAAVRAVGPHPADDPLARGGGRRRVCDALTTAVDLHATLADIFGVTPSHRTHGHSLAPLLRGEATTVRDYAIGGVFGNWVQVTDGQWKYARAPEGQNLPLSMWSNRWSTMPVHVPGLTELPKPDERAWLDRMPGSDRARHPPAVPAGDALPFWVSGGANVGQHHLYDVSVDPDERENRVGEVAERRMQELLRAALHDVEAPTEQLQRLGL
jgi:hypothetical protein